MPTRIQCVKFKLIAVDGRNWGMYFNVARTGFILVVATAFGVAVIRRFPVHMAQLRATYDNAERLAILALWSAALISLLFAIPEIFAILSSVAKISDW